MSKILQVENLVQEFNLTKDFLDKVKFKNGHFSLENRVVHAVNNVSFDVEEGEVFSLVGESGCGKSTTARTIIKLIEPKSGKITFDGRDITRLKPQEMRPIRARDADDLPGSVRFAGSPQERERADRRTAEDL